LRTSTVPVDVTAPLSDPRTRAAVETTSIERYPGYMIAIVEFDDQGRFWDRKQVAAVIGEITRQARTDDDAGIGMLVDVHGWRDDARVCDKALVAFREFVRRISVDDPAKLPGRYPLIGIYVAWRGYSSHIWPIADRMIRRDPDLTCRYLCRCRRKPNRRIAAIVHVSKKGVVFIRRPRRTAQITVSECLFFV